MTGEIFLADNNMLTKLIADKNDKGKKAYGKGQKLKGKGQKGKS